ncbi:MAG: fumarylacetoacetate hydrolase family protein [Chitinophagaceae bacterium]|nr:fumarylacetoacetate hydrolase family protein [Chitinophagaceae bacterium]
MKIVRYQIDNGLVYYGELKNNSIRRILNFSFCHINYDYGEETLVSEATILAPVTPEKVIGLAYNYKDLVGEKTTYDEPLVFLKSPESIIGPNDVINVFEGEVTWAEVELVIVIGKEGKDICLENAAQHIFGYTIGNDVTMANIHGRDHHLARSKALDTFCPVGPYIETSLLVKNLSLIHEINGVLFQKGNTDNRILNDYESVALVSRFIKLKPGDIILTGTPANAMNSLINGGNRVHMEITNLGVLSNQVRFK